MSARIKTELFLLAAILIAEGLACRKPEATVEPDKPRVTAKTVDQAKPDDEARRRAEAEEATRRAEAMKETEFRRTAESALKDVHFDFDKAEIKENEKAILRDIADFMRKYPQVKVGIDGDCDERGTVEYNLALGERRADAAKEYLTGLGVSDSRLSTISYGKEKPVCIESAEPCWGRNRRAHFTLKQADLQSASFSGETVR